MIPKPAFFIITSRAFIIVISPKIFYKLYEVIIVSFAKAIANPNTDLVTGRTAIDNIKLRSILCNSAKIRSFILSSESNETHFLYGIIESAFGQ